MAGAGANAATMEDVMRPTMIAEIVKSAYQSMSANLPIPSTVLARRTSLVSGFEVSVEPLSHERRACDTVKAVTMLARTVVPVV